MIFKAKKEKTIEPTAPFTEKDIVRESPVSDNEGLSPNADKYVSLVNINKVYNRKVHAVVDFNLDVKQREFVVFVGPSGCGKSTTLRMIAGLEEISGGTLTIDGVVSNDLAPKDRDIAMVFQSYSLYPNMSVYDNLAFTLKVKKLPQDEIDRRVREAAEILEITPLLDRKPSQLSGGQRQRVALGRTIVRNAKIMLMDEPLSNLDAKLRVQMRTEIIKLHKKVKATTIYVTHDQIEAMTMADRIVVMKDGYVQQIGTPIEIYRHPANQFVASFLGSPSMNFVDGVYEGGAITFPDGSKIALSKEEVQAHDDFYKKELARLGSTIPEFEEFLRKEAEGKKKKKHMKPIEEDEDLLKMKRHYELVKDIVEGNPHDVRFGIRPEDIVASEEGEEREVILSELLGQQYYVHFPFGGKEIVCSLFSDKLIAPGEKLKLSFKEGKHHLFDYLSAKTIF